MTEFNTENQLTWPMGLELQELDSLPWNSSIQES